jgi:hypothetical protein
LAIVFTMLLSSRRRIDILVLLHSLLHIGVGIHSYVNRNSLLGFDDLGLFMF